MKAVTVVADPRVKQPRPWRAWQPTVFVLVALVVLGTSTSAWAESGKSAHKPPWSGPSAPAHQPPGRGSDGTAGGDPPRPGPLPSPTDASCRDVFTGRPAGSVVKTTSAGPSGNTVDPGQTITVTLTWKPGDFWGRNPVGTADCVEIGTRTSSALSQVHQPGPAGGTDTFTYVVPAQGTGGLPICDRGVVWGSDGGGPIWGHDDEGAWRWGRPGGAERSAVVCYTILADPAPEAPNVILFPVAGLLVGAGALLVVRRRRASARPQQ